ncbi:farnesyl-diphosphate synthase [Sphingorhabdus lutea]|uniref:Farnesyl-diphosphate synthase n=1 Tax=Sphingorhabdus lutea TaxID=1913578 RepID=A0A1L3J9A8_9SPHN|nr:farnesyl diphosphate synthase [Sphingorhabdus lutea]APG61707.1 farnesyl-diphosphate synthase [Sphingorhabdus lutea]
MSKITSDTPLSQALSQIAGRIDADFDLLLPIPDDARAPLYHAMRHAAIGGGKRLRPLLLTQIAAIYNADPDMALRAATAVEAIHVYSLIHDDLPCMDDDDVRRGKPTVHLQFDEAIAVLAGDALHALAFEMLSDKNIFPDPFVRGDLISALAIASGPMGMAGGQMMDLEAEKNNFDLPTITKLQQLKTGALIGVSVEMGAILGHVPLENRTSLNAYARDIGLAFQIADDILDVEGDEALAGKALQKDAKAGKETFVSLMGLARAKAQAEMLSNQAIGHLAGHGKEADLLRDIARYIVERNH